jgi:hypothetical protein
MAYTRDTSLFLGDVDLSDVRAKLVDSDAALITGDISDGFVSLNNGWFLWHYDAYPDGFRGAVVFYLESTSVVLTSVAFNPEENEIDKTLAALQTAINNLAQDEITIRVNQSDLGQITPGSTPISNGFSVTTGVR